MQQSSTLDCSKEFPPIPCLWKIACFPQALSQSCSVCSICLHPEHVFQNIRLIHLSSAVYLQINLSTETPCQLTLKGAPATEPAAKEQSWRWWFTLRIATHWSIFTAKSVFKKKCQRMPWTRLKNADLKNKTRKTAHLENCTSIDPK